MADGDEYGPALPPAMAQPKAPVLPIGPVLPPGFMSPQESSNSPQQSETKDDDCGTGALVTVSSGPTQTEEASTSEDMSVIGPMMSEMNHGDEVVQAAEEFERRSRRMKDHLTVKAEAEPGPSKREEWMTELPPEMGKNMGLGLTARTFSKGTGTGTDKQDRSEWTDTPADKLRKEKEGKSKKRKRDESEKNPSKLRDDQLQQQIEEYNKKKRPDSLMEMHQKAKKKKKKKEEKKRKKDKKKGKEKKEERRPFDRDQDLKANRFDDAQRKSIIKKSAMLNTRFHHSGATSSFL